MSSITSLRDSSNSRLQSSLDDETRTLIDTTKQALGSFFLTRNQSVALDRAIQVLTLRCFEKSDNKCQSPEDITKMFSRLLATFSFKYIIYQKPSDTQAVNLSLTIEKQQMSFCRVVEFFCKMVSNKNPHWNDYEFSSSFEDSFKSPTNDFFLLKLVHNPFKKNSSFEPIIITRPLHEIIVDLTNSQDCVVVHLPIPEAPLSLGQRLSQFNVREHLSALSLGLKRFLPTSAFDSAKPE